MKTELKILNTASAFSGFAAGLFGPFYAVFIEEIGGGALIAGNSYSVFAIAAGVLVLFLNRIEENYDRMDLLVFTGYMTLSAAYFAYYFVDVAWEMLLIQAVVGIGTAIISPAFDELYSKNISNGNFASGWGVWESMSWIITGISASVGGLIVQQIGFKSLFLIMGMLELTAGMVAGLLMYNNQK